MASRIVQQGLRAARATSKQAKALDRKFAFPFTHEEAGPANVYNSITTRPTTTPNRTVNRTAQGPATTTKKVGGKTYATIAPTAMSTPWKSASEKVSMAFDEGANMKPTLENAVEHVEMLSKIIRENGGGMKTSAEQMQKILAVGAMRI